MHTEYALISNSFYKKALICFLYVPESGVGVLLAKLNSAVRLNGPGSLQAVWIFSSLYIMPISISLEGVRKPCDCESLSV